MKTSKTNAFTLIELLVVISIIAILAGIALPVFGQVQVKGAQTKALSNAKQIATALKLYAIDNSGIFPSYQLMNGQPASPPVDVTSSNAAFAQLIPDYVPTEDIFWLAKSKWCNPIGADDQIDNPPADTPVKTLASGENEWAYVLELTDTSNAAFPVIADGFMKGGDKGTHNYTKDATLAGGVWQGKAAIVVHVDTSAAVMKTDTRNNYIISGPNGGNANGDIFDVSNSANGWLGSTNTTVNPLPYGN
jgi:prepilin-type N-terminal cleavage/methylation domain-containing protein